jgi:hypothetical protein
MIIRICSLIRGSYKLAWRGCRGEQRGGGLPGLRARREAEVGEFRFQQGL